MTSTRITKHLVAVVPLAIVGGTRVATAAGFGVPALDAFLTTFALGVTGMGVLVGGIGLVGWIGSTMENPFSTILAGSVNFFTKAGLLGGGTAMLTGLGLVAGGTL